MSNNVLGSLIDFTKKNPNLIIEFKTKTNRIKELLEMVKSRIPTFRDLPQDKDHAGWPLYSYVMEGINLLDKSKALNEIQSLQLFDAPFDIQESNVEEILQKRDPGAFENLFKTEC